jgi:hypothetical protein
MGRDSLVLHHTSHSDYGAFKSYGLDHEVVLHDVTRHSLIGLALISFASDSAGRLPTLGFFLTLVPENRRILEAYLALGESGFCAVICDITSLFSMDWTTVLGLFRALAEDTR